MLITSKDNSRVKEMRKLLNSKYSKEKGEFIVEGENLIDEAIMVVKDKKKIKSKEFEKQ